MKINKRTSYPYPIWGWNDDYTIEIQEEDFTIKEIEDKEDFVYELELLAHNSDIERYIADGAAVYACSIDCATTFYHDFIPSEDAKFQIRIPRKSVNKKVEVKWMIVAQKAITNFQSEYLNPDYGGRTSFPKGAMLAYITSFEINPELSGELHSFDDLFIVVKNTVSDNIEYWLEGDKIAIALPEEQLEIFNSAAGQKYAHVIHATIAEQALIKAIFNVKKYSTKDWANIISQYIDSSDDEEIPSWESIENGEAELTIENALTIAEDMLKYPVKRMFGNIRNAYEELEASND